MARVLVIEEEKLTAISISRLLASHGHAVAFENDLSDFPEGLKDSMPEVIVLDIHVIAEKGISILEKIRTICPDSGLILSYSKDIPESVREMIRKEKAEVIEKPFSHLELLLSVDRAVERRRLYLENKSLLISLEERVKELSTLNVIAKTLNSTLKLKEVLDIIMNRIRELIRAEAWSILMIDEETDELVFEAAAGEGSERLKDIRLKIGEGIAGWVAKEGRPAIVHDVEGDPRFFNDIDNKTNFRTRSILAVPLISRGRIIGVVEVLNKEGGDKFNEKDLELLNTLADNASIAVENARLYEKLGHLAITDDLTKLRNSRYCDIYLDNAIEEAKNTGGTISIIFIDLDNLKEVDDHFGHLMGGKTLVEVAQRIKDTVKDEGMISRYGGDEFVIILPGADSVRAYQVAENVRKGIEAWPFLVEEGLNKRITASFGVANYPAHAKSTQELLQKADKAMYKVKETGKNRTAIAEGEM